jgi:hypothetical protein
MSPESLVIEKRCQDRGLAFGRLDEAIEWVSF